jgi:enamine deaminase RidA (YjgF/YER057c/UK114 family)
MSLQKINPESLLYWPAMAHVVVAMPGRLAFIAGQAPVDKDYKIVGGTDLKAQTLCAFQHLCVALAAAGAGPADVICSTAYLVDLDEDKAATFAAAMSVAVRGAPFPPHAITMVGVRSLASAEALVEISAVALIPSTV